MIRFACREIGFSELIRCSLNMSKAEYRIFIFMVEREKPLKIKEISKALGIDRTSVQKILKKLMEKGMVKRRQKNLEGGGYLYIYSIQKKEEIKEWILQKMEEWMENAKESVRKW